MTPSLESSSRPSRSKTLPSSGVSSICFNESFHQACMHFLIWEQTRKTRNTTFQSPVWRIVPSAQRRTSPEQSGIEWVTLMGSISNGPALNFLFVLNVLSLDGTKIPNSFNRLLISCSDMRDIKIGKQIYYTYVCYITFGR